MKLYIVDFPNKRIDKRHIESELIDKVEQLEGSRKAYTMKYSTGHYPVIITGYKTKIQAINGLKEHLKKEMSYIKYLLKTI